MNRPTLSIRLLAVAALVVVPAIAGASQMEARAEVTVTDAQGNPIEGATVLVVLLDSGSRMNVSAGATEGAINMNFSDRRRIDEIERENPENVKRTDAEGEASILGLHVRVRYVLAVERDGYRSYRERRIFRPAVNQIHVVLRSPGGEIGGEAFQQGRQAYDAGDCAAATEHMSVAVDLLSSSPDASLDVTKNALAVLGQCELKLGNVAEAEEAMMRLVGVDPSDPYAHQALGQINAQRGDLEAAEDHFRYYQEIRPDAPAGHLGLGLVYAQMGEREQAIEHLERYLELDPNGPGAQQARQVLAQLQG